MIGQAFLHPTLFHYNISGSEPSTAGISANDWCEILGIACRINGKVVYPHDNSIYCLIMCTRERALQLGQKIEVIEDAERRIADYDFLSVILKIFCLKECADSPIFLLSLRQNSNKETLLLIL